METPAARKTPTMARCFEVSDVSSSKNNPVVDQLNNKLINQLINKSNNKLIDQPIKNKFSVAIVMENKMLIFWPTTH